MGSDGTLFRGKENRMPLRVRRLEGWDTPVEVWAENLPKGVTSRPVSAKPENTKYKGACAEDHFFDGTDVEVPLIVSADAPTTLTQIRFRARGVMNGRVVEREARTQYWWKSRQKARGDSETTSLYATIADPPQLVLTTPYKISIVPGESDKLRVLIARFDDGKTPLQLEAGALPTGVVVEPTTVPAGAAVAELNVSNGSSVPVAIWLVGKVEGAVLGKSNPILIEPTSKTEQVTDEN